MKFPSYGIELQALNLIWQAVDAKDDERLRYWPRFIKSLL